MIICKGSTLVLKFNKFFYSKNSILLAKKEYSPYCDIRIMDAKQYLQVTLTSFKTNLDHTTIGLEFSNCVLAQQN
jgi:hypothetical protein